MYEFARCSHGPSVSLGTQSVLLLNVREAIHIHTFSVINIVTDTINTIYMKEQSAGQKTSRALFYTTCAGRQKTFRLYSRPYSRENATVTKAMKPLLTSPAILDYGSMHDKSQVFLV